MVIIDDQIVVIDPADSGARPLALSLSFCLSLALPPSLLSKQSGFYQTSCDPNKRCGPGNVPAEEGGAYPASLPTAAPPRQTEKSCPPVAATPDLGEGQTPAGRHRLFSDLLFLRNHKKVVT